VHRSNHARIDTMTNPRAFFERRSLEIPHVTAFQSSPPPRQACPQSSVGPELVPGAIGEGYTYCGRACCGGDHRVSANQRCSAAASLSSCGEKEGSGRGARFGYQVCAVHLEQEADVRYGHASLLLRAEEVVVHDM